LGNGFKNFLHVAGNKGKQLDIAALNYGGKILRNSTADEHLYPLLPKFPQRRR
jgi:hypothetical protein